MALVGSCAIVRAGMIAHCRGLLQKPPLTARTLHQHVYRVWGISRPTRMKSRDLPLFPSEAKIRFEVKNGERARPVSSTVARLSRSKRDVRFLIDSAHVPEIIARHEYRQGGRSDWQQLANELTGLLAESGLR